MATTNAFSAKPASPHAQAHVEPQASERQGSSSGGAGDENSAAPEINVGSTERLASVLGGSLLTLVGMRRRSNFGALLAILGGGLVYRGMTGHCPAYSYLRKNTAQGRRAEPEEDFQPGVYVKQAGTIHKPTAELYPCWGELAD